MQAGLHSTTQADVIATVCDLIEASIHTVLHTKQVYPKEWFDRCRFGSIQVFKCRHPAVQSYVGSVVSNLKPLLLKEQIADISILLHGADRQPLQRIILLLEILVLSPQQSEAIDWGAVSSQLSSTLVKLQLLDNVVVQGHQQPEPGCHWDVEVRCRAREEVDLKFWEEQPLPNTNPSAELQPPLRHVVPFKSLNVPGLLRLHVLIEACRPLTAAT